MAKCPDCHGVHVPMFGEEIGDGNCNDCVGTGKGPVYDQVISDLVNEESICETCDGTGECQTCEGTGEVD